MKYRKSRIAFSAACLLAGMLLIALWVRSYGWLDEVSGPTPNGLGFHVYSSHGFMVCSQGSPAGQTQDKSWEVDFGREPATEEPAASKIVLRGFDMVREPCAIRVYIPLWFPVLLSTVLATTPWMIWIRWRFSLKTLLIATTIIAMVLGIFAISQ